MAKKRRTKADKIKARQRSVKSQFEVSFDPGSIKLKKEKSPKKSVESKSLASVKKDIIKSLIIASLILASILMLYWFS